MFVYVRGHLSVAACPLQSPLQLLTTHTSLPSQSRTNPHEHKDNKTHIRPLAIHPPLTHLLSQSDKGDLRTVVGQECSSHFWQQLPAPKSLKFSDIATLLLFTPLSLNKDKSKDLHILPKGFSVL